VNALLNALPPSESERLSSLLETVSLAARDVLYEPDEQIDHVYFPDGGVLSLLALDESASAVEVGTIGSEGTTALPIFHGQDSAPQQLIAQIAGSARRMTSNAFAGAVRDMPALQLLLHQYAHCFFNDVAQTVVCNHLHSVEQRCARWLLMTHDRVAGNTFELTHEFLSLMLATRRASVTVAAARLKRRKLISYTRGKVRVIDRDGLENAACSCYRITRAAYNGLIGPK
jgi:CRP-like cAMP-binding protein